VKAEEALWQEFFMMTLMSPACATIFGLYVWMTNNTWNVTEYLGS